MVEFEDESIHRMNRKSLSVAPFDKPMAGRKRKAAAEVTAESESSHHGVSVCARALVCVLSFTFHPHERARSL